MKNILITAMLFATVFIGFGQTKNATDKTIISGQIVDYLPKILNDFKVDNRIVVVDKEYFELMPKSKIVDLRRSSEGLSTFLLVEVFYSTYQISYSFYKNDRLINRIFKNY
ncbi:hypothetical protein SAMN05444278_1042 [Psychroflexus salarius]|uniref:Uncharacterized protein n=1 Tax=Psychroflexus salarius TaxID=1155689 RepID=A0A1M4VDI5_9FLAO|nr:hypothetical protein [Psychroflexus salarius]SHE66977.1 hypothetical protein SAMN05444278_1042 [Psychroflexus salarius]